MVHGADLVADEADALEAGEGGEEDGGGLDAVGVGWVVADHLAVAHGLVDVLLGVEHLRIVDHLLETSGLLVGDVELLEGLHGREEGDDISDGAVEQAAHGKVLQVGQGAGKLAELVVVGTLTEAGELIHVASPELVHGNGSNHNVLQELEAGEIEALGIQIFELNVEPETFNVKVGLGEELNGETVAKRGTEL